MTAPLLAGASDPVNRHSIPPVPPGVSRLEHGMASVGDVGVVLLHADKLSGNDPVDADTNLV